MVRRPHPTRVGTYWKAQVTCFATMLCAHSASASNRLAPRVLVVPEIARILVQAQFVLRLNYLGCGLMPFCAEAHGSPQRERISETRGGR